MSRRKRFALRVTLGYAVSAGLWIFLSDRALASFSDLVSITQFSTLKGLFFILVTALMLWLALQRVPDEAAPVQLLDDTSPESTIRGLLWGLALPVLAAGLQWSFGPTLNPIALLLFCPAAFAAAWMGGYWAGVVATALSAVLAWWAFMPKQPNSVVALGVFCALGFLVSLVLRWFRQTEHVASNARFKALVEQSLAGIYMLQSDRLIYANLEFAHMLGYDSPDQIVKRIPLLDMVAPDDREQVAELLKQRIAQPHQSSPFAFAGLRRDGSTVQLEVHGRSVPTPSGPIVIGLVLDVTARHRTEAALQRSEQLLRAAIEGTTDSVFVKDMAGRYLMVNQACATFLNESIEDIIGRDDTELFPAKSAAKIHASDERIKQSGASVTSEGRLTLANGEQRIFLFTKGPIFDAQGKMSGVFGMARDISTSMAIQNDLREKQLLLDRMSTLAKVGGWSIDLTTWQGTRTTGAARILDLDPALPSSLHFTDGLRYFEDQERAMVRQALLDAAEQGHPFELEVELTSVLGVRKWISTRGEPIWKDGKVVRVEGAIQDISEIKHARQALQAQQELLEQTVRERTAELEAARQEAERLSQIKGEFLANMSHEIRTPLNGVLGLAQIGHRDHAGSAHHIFGQILDSGRLLLGIINDILDFSKIEAGQLRIEAVPVHLADLLDRATAQFQVTAAGKGISLRTQVSTALPERCESDPLRLEQILLNLLSNAVKFTSQGEVSVSATLAEGRLVLTVADTGIGMNAQQLEALFHPFAQADGSTTRQYGGTGLGLSITKRLVEMMGGEIHAHSEPGRGTKFEVRLPLVPVQSSTPALAPPSGAHPQEADLKIETPVGQRLAGLRVLAADDNEVNQWVLTEMLQIEGAVVTMVASGAEALSQLQTHGPSGFDLVLMDIQMPIMDGYDATRRIKAIAPALPVIGQTAHAMAEERDKCLAAGMVNLVVKPINLEDLVQTVLRHAPR